MNNKQIFKKGERVHIVNSLYAFREKTVTFFRYNKTDDNIGYIIYDAHPDDYFPILVKNLSKIEITEVNDE